LLVLLIQQTPTTSEVSLAPLHRLLEFRGFDSLLLLLLLLVVVVAVYGRCTIGVAPGRQPGSLLRGGDTSSLLERLLLLVRPLRPRVSHSGVVGDILVSAEHFLFLRPAAVLVRVRQAAALLFLGRLHKRGRRARE
jgi:hypothetical protein